VTSALKGEAPLIVAIGSLDERYVEHRGYLSRHQPGLGLCGGRGPRSARGDAKLSTSSAVRSSWSVTPAVSTSVRSPSSMVDYLERHFDCFGSH